MITTEELQQLARAATPGPWEIVSREDEEGSAEFFVGFKRGKGQIWFEKDSTLMDEPDARYIAACSPERILALTETVEAAEKLVAQVRKSVAEWHTDSTPMADLADALTIYDEHAKGK